MKVNNFFYLFKEGIKGIFLHAFQSFAAVCATVACLLIVGLFFALMQNVSVIVDELNQTNEIMVYIDETLTDSEAKSIETQIRTIDNVMHATFRSREQALEDFIADMDGNAAFSGVEADTFRHRVVVVLEDNALIKETIEQIRTVKGVADITAYYELAEGFSSMRDILRIVSSALIIVLLVVSLLVISNTVRMAMLRRREEIFIMKMVGATNGFIRLPFVVEGVFLGMTGSGIAFALNWLIYDFLVKQLDAMDTMNIISMVPFSDLLGTMVFVFVGAGLLVSFTGSYTSIRKFLNV